MIEVISYDSVNGLKFGASPEEALEILGEPESIDKKDNETVFYYSVTNPNDYDYIVHIDDDEGFAEFEIIPHTKAQIDGIELGWTLKEILPVIEMDSNPLICDRDSIVLYDLGVVLGAFLYSDYDFNDKSILFFKKGYRDDLKKDAEPFSIEYAKQLIQEKDLDIQL